MPVKVEGLFTAHIEHETSGLYKVRDTRITFKCVVEAETGERHTALIKQAIRDAMRWYKHRQQFGPEWFGTLYCITVYMFTPQVIDAKGAMPMATGFPIFEWKYDWGGTFEQYLESRIK